MKTIQHVTTVKTVDGKDLSETLSQTTTLSIPETEDDVLTLMSEKGVTVVCKWITDSLKLERNGEIRPVMLAKAGLGKITGAVRDKVMAYLSETDLPKCMELLKVGGKAKDAALDKFYNDATEEVRKEILAK